MFALIVLSLVGWEMTLFWSMGTKQRIRSIKVSNKSGRKQVKEELNLTRGKKLERTTIVGPGQVGYL